MVALRCIDQAGISSELRPEAVASGFQELGCYEFIAPMEGATLFIDEAPAQIVLEDGVQRWRWQPGFYAGRVVAELVSGAGQRLAEYRIDVAPDTSKLGADVFGGMLDELYAFDPRLLLGTEAAQASIGVTGDTCAPLLAYARLRRYGDALLKALREVARQPLKRLHRERKRVPYHRVRRIDSASARDLLRRPDTAAFLRGDVGFADDAIPLFEVVHSTEDLDCPANRALTSKLLAVRRCCTQVAAALQAMVGREERSNSRTPLEPRLARRLEFLDELAAGLAKVARIDPYSSVSRQEVTAAGLNAISAHPSYARAYRFAWSALRPGVAGDLRDESLWISPTWEIYERWCFIRVAAILRKAHSDLSWTLKYPSAQADSIRLVGESSGTRIEASLQRTFPPGSSKSGAFRSVSLQLKPDLLVTMESGNQRKMLVFDAKYRTSRQNVLDAMRSAHLYQDALRWDGGRPDCSLLLVPSGGGAPWLEDPDFHTAHRVGVQVLTPGAESSALGTLLSKWFWGGAA